MKTKQCTKCKKIKPLSEFDKGKNYKGGYRSWCKSCRKKYYINNYEKFKKRVKKYQTKNKQKIREYMKKWRQENKEYLNEYGKKYFRTRKKKDLSFKLACHLRSKINKALRRNQKSGHAIDLLDCSIEYLKKYLEKLFKKGMTWENWATNGWHIDHIKPISSFDLTKKSEQKKCFHYTNLQPLWAKENIRKGNK